MRFICYPDKDIRFVYPDKANFISFVTLINIKILDLLP